MNLVCIQIWTPLLSRNVKGLIFYSIASYQVSLTMSGMLAEYMTTLSQRQKTLLFIAIAVARVQHLHWFLNTTPTCYKLIQRGPDDTSNGRGGC